MNGTHHPGLRNRLLLTLDALPDGATVKGLIQFSDGPREAVLHTLEALRARGGVTCDAAGGGWRKKDSPLWERAAREAREAVRGEETDDPLLEGLGRMCDGRWLVGAELLLLLIRKFMKKGRSAGALLCLDLLLRCMREAAPPGRSESEDLRFVAVYKELLGASLYMGKRQDEILDMLGKARQACTVWGDARSVLLLDLYLGIAQQLNASHNTDIAFSLISNAIRGIKDFEDAELYESIGPALGVYYQIEGDFREASKFLKGRHSNRFLDKLDYLAEMGVRYRAGGLMITGRHAQAVGLLAGALREARLLRLPLPAKWRQVQLAQFLMWTGRQDAALELLDPVICRTDPVSETKLWIFCVRLLAFYFFHKGDLARAHHVLSSAMRDMAGKSERRPFYGFPWLLELLWAFEREGMPRVPGHDFENEVSLALRSPNKLFRGTALRIKAARQAAAGERPETVVESLRESLFYMESVKDPAGTARTRLALAESLREAGETAEAEMLYRQAYEVLHAYGQHDRPQVPPPGAHGLATRVPDGRARLDALRRLLDKELPLADSSCFVQCLVEMLCQELDLERAALFELDGGRLECAGACNISRAEMESQLFARRKNWLSARAGTHAPGLTVEKDYTGLCLPVSAGESRYLLFVESNFFPGHVTGQPPEVFAALAALLGEKLELLHSVRRQVDAVLQREDRRAKEAHERLLSRCGDVFITPSLQHSIHTFDQAARTDAPILITGETGAGKEGLARRAHEQSGRAGAFVPVHPGGMPEPLFESEFFGHEKGAFTGAHQRKIGLFEIADKGTLFIDEVGDIPMHVQVKLLRVLQEKSFHRVGGIREVRSDFRLLAATNRDLEKMVAEGAFRRDLYYRISVIPFSIPPLRQRPDDILFLAHKFIEQFSRRYGKSMARLTGRQRAQMLAYAWPGNIRELKSVLERAVILSTDSVLHLHLTGGPAEAKKGREARFLRGPHAEAPREPDNGSGRESDAGPLWEGLPSMEELEQRYIAHVLKMKKGKINGDDGALAVLGMKRSTLYMKIKKFKLDAVTQLYGDGGRAE